MNLREMFGLRVPIISVVIGEGGSGGALAIGCSNWNLIMEHSVYYVASPEACAAILWKSRDKAATVRPCTAWGRHALLRLQRSSGICKSASQDGLVSCKCGKLQMPGGQAL